MELLKYIWNDWFGGWQKKYYFCCAVACGAYACFYARSHPMQDVNLPVLIFTFGYCLGKWTSTKP